MGQCLSFLHRTLHRRSKVLFLTTQPPETIRAEWPYYQNWFLPSLIRDRGADVHTLCWRDPSLDVSALSSYGIVTFLWCNNYHAYPVDFPNFVRSVLIPAQALNPRQRIINDPNTVLWNCDKHYLLELADAGFSVPRSKFVDTKALTRASLISLIQVFSEVGSAVVLKPAVSGSARGAHLITNPKDLKSEDIAFVERVVEKGVNGDLILQEYEPAIEKGEYSLIFVNGQHTHTILKTPRAGEYRCQGEYGGSVDEIAKSDVPLEAKDAAMRIWKFMEEKFAGPDRRGGLLYARIDGIMKNKRFVLMEVEAVEPHLWLEADSGKEALEQLCKILCRRTRWKV